MYYANKYYSKEIRSLILENNNIFKPFLLSLFKNIQKIIFYTTSDGFIGYVGLNNGNGRGSMDSLFTDSNCFLNNIACGST